MIQILLNLSYAIFIVYFHDVMVIGRSFTKHLEDLQEVSEKFCMADLKLKLENVFSLALRFVLRIFCV